MRVYEWPFVKSYLKKAYSSEIQFLLTNQGLRIGKGVKKLVLEYMTVEQGSHQWCVWADSRYKYCDTDNTAWIIKPVRPEDPYCQQFNIELSVKGVRKPRLITNSANPLFYTKLIATTVGWHGYDKPEQNNWTIDYYQEKDKKSMRKYNRVQKKKSNQADKLSKYLINVVTGKGEQSSELQAKQFKELMKLLGLDDKSINYDSIIQNPEQFQSLKEQIVILIMQKDLDEQAMNQVDGMVKLIENEPKQ